MQQTRKGFCISEIETCLTDNINIKEQNIHKWKPLVFTFSCLWNLNLVLLFFSRGQIHLFVVGFFFL